MLRPFKIALSGNVRAGLVQNGPHIELAMVRRHDDGALSLSAANIDPRREDADWTKDLRSGIEHGALRKARVSAVLGAHAYTLQLVEAPGVPAAEMCDAIRWRVQHLVEFPIDEVAIEVFEMPEPANPGAPRMIYAVVAHRNEIRKQVDQVNAANLHMDAIDIPELCIRNVAARLPQDAVGVAFLHFTDDCGYLTITRRGVLYMIRRIETRKGQLNEATDGASTLRERSEGIALEVQRSLDYYESNYDCSPVTELVIGPGNNLNTLTAQLADNLGIVVSRLDLADMFSIESAIDPDVQNDCLIAVGAALRPDEAGSMAGAS
jgi:MSHA biogenesis protein MshI